MIKAIACVDENWAIGKDNDLLFKLPADLKFFKAATKNKVVVCGYNTLLSFPGGKPLKGRSTICLCSKENARDDCFCIHDLCDLINLIRELSKTQDVYIIGGGMLYRALINLCEEVLVTMVHADGNGTVFFPNLDKNPDFELIDSEECLDDGPYSINFCTYRRNY